MRLQLFVSCLFLLAASVAACAQEPRADVLMIGVFHFANPGLDTVKTDQVDVTTPANQAWLEEFTTRLATFRPTRILVETPPEQEEILREEYEQFLAGTFTLPANETYQLGFRVARKAGLDGVTGFDERGIPWETQAMFAYMEAQDPDALRRFNDAISEVTRRIATAHRELSLGALLRLFNEPDMDSLNRDLYLLTNEVAAGDGFHGATASASWWERNFRMYANIQRHAQPGERVLVIAGQGHTAVLRQFLATDSRRNAVDVLDFLEDGGE